jgi:diguanylate cyclase (GGDEF)-like protein
MPPFPRPKIAILTCEPEVERRLAAALSDAVEIVLIPGGDPEQVEFDVLVTDLRSDPALHATSRPVRAEDAASRGQSKQAVLGIGSATEGWADVTLSDDCTPREIRLACNLLGEIARLRKDSDQIAQSHQEIKRVADTDPLTKLANRRAWDRQLKLKCHRANANHYPLWMAIVDLDHFKPINDRWGLVAGDRVLAHAAQALASQLRSADVIARLGGDEFGVLLAGINERSALQVFDRLRAAVAAEAVETSAGRLTASIGFAGASEHCSADDLFAAAEQALRQAKRAGGNRVSRGEIRPPSPSETGLG